MSKRLQVIMDEPEFGRLREVARSQHIPVGEFVRRAIRKEIKGSEATTVDGKIQAILEAARESYPISDIAQMNEEIDLGYQTGLP